MCQEYPLTEPLPEVTNFTRAPSSPTEASTPLGLQWNIYRDAFGIKKDFKNCPKTKSGFLSHRMAVHDHLGIAEPAMLTCKLIQRELFPRKDEEDSHCMGALGWEGPIPTHFHKQWDKMVATCKYTANLKIFHQFYPPIELKRYYLKRFMIFLSDFQDKKLIRLLVAIFWHSLVGPYLGRSVGSYSSSENIRQVQVSRIKWQVSNDKYPVSSIKFQGQM